MLHFKTRCQCWTAMQQGTSPKFVVCQTFAKYNLRLCILQSVSPLYLKGSSKGEASEESPVTKWDSLAFALGGAKQ